MKIIAERLKENLIKSQEDLIEQLYKNLLKEKEKLIELKNR